MPLLRAPARLREWGRPRAERQRAHSRSDSTLGLVPRVQSLWRRRLSGAPRKQKRPLIRAEKRSLRVAGLGCCSRRGNMCNDAPRRQRLRTDQVAKHDGQLPALRRRGGRGVCGETSATAAGPTRKPAIAAKIAQRWPTEATPRSFRLIWVLLESRSAKRAQPLGDIHRRLPRRRVAGCTRRVSLSSLTARRCG
jgi:hypothetical protein